MLAAIFLLIGATSRILTDGFFWIVNYSGIFSVCAIFAIVSLNMSVLCKRSFLMKKLVLRRVLLIGVLIGILFAIGFMLNEGFHDFLRHPIMWSLVYLVPSSLAIFGIYRIILVETNTTIESPLVK
jgi:hypothetical protein